MADNQKDNLYQKDKSLPVLSYDPVSFKGDYDIYLLYRRIENTIAALSLVIQQMSESADVKKSLKDSCVKCLNATVSFINSNDQETDMLQTLSGYVLEMGSLITTGYWTNSISHMNAELLQKELNKIRDTISSLVSKYFARLVIDTSVFTDVDLHQKHHQSAVAVSQAMNAQRQTKEKNIQRMDMPATPSPTTIFREPDASPIKKTERREAILALLRQQNNLSIKDFLAVVKDYSEKTIQRELIALVEEGIIKKEGERRWSTYSIIQ